MATLLTVPDLPSSDEEDLDFAPNGEAGPANAFSNSTWLKRNAQQAALGHAAKQHCTDAGVNDLSKKARALSAWDKLSGNQQYKKALPKRSATTIATLCTATASESPAPRQVRKLAWLFRK